VVIQSVQVPISSKQGSSPVPAWGIVSLISFSSLVHGSIVALKDNNNLPWGTITKELSTICRWPKFDGGTTGRRQTEMICYLGTSIDVNDNSDSSMAQNSRREGRIRYSFLPVRCRLKMGGNGQMVSQGALFIPRPWGASRRSISTYPVPVSLRP